MVGEAQRLEALQEVALAVNSSLDLNHVLDVILGRACDLLEARHGSIMLLDEARAALTIAVAHGLAPEVVTSTRVTLGEGVAGGVAATGASRCLQAGSRQREGRTVDVPAAICVPLKAGDAVIGVLNVSDRLAGGEFTPADVRLAESLAAQSAVAINNARAFETQQQHAAELQALQQISLTVTESLDIGDTLRQVLDQAISLLGAGKGSILLLEPDEPVLRIAVAHGLSPEVIAQTRVQLGQGVAGVVARSGKPRNLPAGVRAAGSHVAADDLPAALCVPLAVAGQIIGVLNVADRRRGGNFSEHDLGILSTLGAQAAVGINNARLYEGVSRRAAALSALNEIGQALSGSLDRDDVLQTVLDKSLRLLQCAKGSLMLVQTESQDAIFDPDKPSLDNEPPHPRHLSIVVARGLPPEVIESTHIHLGDGVAGRVAETGELEVMAQGQVAEASRSRARSASLCLPLKAKEHVIGVLNLSEHAGGNFDSEEIALGVTLAAQAAAAIENAQLYDDLRDQFVHSIRVIANAIDARDPYTRGHSERVAAYSRLIAAEMGLSDEEVEQIYHAGLLHDVGKIGIRDNILLKDGRLTDEEFGVMKQHPVKSAEIIHPVKQLRHILPGLRHHHERYSSRGYPDGLHEEEIPLMARVIGVADTYDAMTSDRPYRRALPRRVALEELAKNRGSQFDPNCVNAFLRLVAKGQVAPIDGQGDEGEADVEAALAAVAEKAAAAAAAQQTAG
jgi:HD-GYP domain-containing protein (c-di-GMP phosphodiesterase class II)